MSNEQSTDRSSGPHLQTRLISKSAHAHTDGAPGPAGSHLAFRYDARGHPRTSGHDFALPCARAGLFLQCFSCSNLRITIVHRAQRGERHGCVWLSGERVNRARLRRRSSIDQGLGSSGGFCAQLMLGTVKVRAGSRES